jgi:hypothetical protein
VKQDIPFTDKRIRIGKRARPKGKEPHHWYVVIETVGSASVIAVPALVRLLRKR